MITQFVDLPTPNGRRIAAADLNAAFATVIADGAFLLSAGLKMDGIADDAPALQAVVNGASGNLRLILPAASILLGSQIVSTGLRGIAIEGAGPNHTVLNWANAASNGWTHGAGGAQQGTFSVRGVSFQNPLNGGGVGLRVSVGALLQNPTPPRLIVDNCMFGRPAGQRTWHVGIEGHGCWNSSITNTFVFQSPFSLDPNNVGVLWNQIENTTGAAGVTTVLTCDNLFIQGGHIGLAVYGAVQGVNLINSNISGPNYGIFWSSAIGVDGADALQVNNSQFSTAIRGINAYGVNHPIITSSYFIQFDNQSINHNWCAIDLVNCPSPMIMGNHLINPGGALLSNVAAIKVGGAHPMLNAPGVVTHNGIFTQNVTAIELSGAVYGIAVTENVCFNHAPGTAADLQTAAPTWTANTTYPPLSASTTTAGLTYVTVAGGVSGASGPSVALQDGTVLWVYAGASLATYPNPRLNNRNYGNSDIRVDASGSVVSDAFSWRLPKFLSIGHPGDTDANFDFEGGNAPTYNARMQCVGGTGVDGSGDLYLTSKTFHLQAGVILVGSRELADDVAAAAAGLAIGQIYHTGNVVKVRVQ